MTAVQHEIYPKVLQALSLLAEGRTVTSACDEVGVAVGTFRRYINASDELATMFAEAEQRGYDAMADALLEIDRHSHYGSTDPRIAKIASDNIKWYLAKKRPKEYGERVQVDVNLTADKAITDALDRARQRSLPSRPEMAVIDVTPDVLDAGATDDDETLAYLLS